MGQLIYLLDELLNIEDPELRQRLSVEAEALLRCGFDDTQVLLSLDEDTDEWSVVCRHEE